MIHFLSLEDIRNSEVLQHVLPGRVEDSTLATLNAFPLHDWHLDYGRVWSEEEEQDFPEDRGQLHIKIEKEITLDWSNGAVPYGAANATVFESDPFTRLMRPEFVLRKSHGVTAVAITNGGSGYLFAPTVIFTPTLGGSGAIAVAHLTGGVVTSITMTAIGTGYIEAPTVSFMPAAGETGGGAAGTATLNTGVHLSTITGPDATGVVGGNLVVSGAPGSAFLTNVIYNVGFAGTIPNYHNLFQAWVDDHHFGEKEKETIQDKLSSAVKALVGLNFMGGINTLDEFPTLYTQVVAGYIFARLGRLYLFEDGSDILSVVRLPPNPGRPTDYRLNQVGNYIEGFRIRGDTNEDRINSLVPQPDEAIPFTSVSVIADWTGSGLGFVTATETFTKTITEITKKTEWVTTEEWV